MIRRVLEEIGQGLGLVRLVAFRRWVAKPREGYWHRYEALNGRVRRWVFRPRVWALGGIVPVDAVFSEPWAAGIRSPIVVVMATECWTRGDYLRLQVGQNGDREVWTSAGWVPVQRLRAVR